MKEKTQKTPRNGSPLPSSSSSLQRTDDQPDKGDRSDRHLKGKKEKAPRNGSNTPAGASSLAKRQDDKPSKADNSNGHLTAKQQKVPRNGSTTPSSEHTTDPKRDDHKRKKEKQSRDKKYDRGPPNKYKGVRDHNLNTKLRKADALFKEATTKMKKAEILLQNEPGFLEAEGLEKTYRFKQSDLRHHVDVTTARKMFDLSLPLGPYNVDFTRNGRFMVIAGRKGHVAVMDWSSGQLSSEMQLQETVRDVHFLHNETMFAVAQKKYVYVYDKNGVELHCLKRHLDVSRIDFLPYHWLLVSVGNQGILRYQDTSTGEMVASHRTKLGPCDCMRQNPWNAVMNLGHSKGVVTMWSPSMPTPLVKMFCHPAPVVSLAASQDGQYLVTGALNNEIKVWDLRTYKELHRYRSVRPASSIDISATSLIAIGQGPHIEVWKDGLKERADRPYMYHLLPSQTIRSVRFCPFEDILATGYSGGVATLAVPGAGEPNYDTFEADPFQTKHQRREGEIIQLLNKLQPDMISLNPNIIGAVRVKKRVSVNPNKAGEAVDDDAELEAEEADKQPSFSQSKKKPNKGDLDRKARELQRRKVERAEAKRKASEAAIDVGAGASSGALSRFYKRRKPAPSA
uniref:BING4 C-terminal domain-containing protein n=1 Tax=Cyanoptyche gloeocystis TaxID=77922 RepID=A0A7S2JLM7_9EUKA